MQGHQSATPSPPRPRAVFMNPSLLLLVSLLPPLQLMRLFIQRRNFTILPIHDRKIRQQTSLIVLGTSCPQTRGKTLTFNKIRQKTSLIVLGTSCPQIRSKTLTFNQFYCSDYSLGGDFANHPRVLSSPFFRLLASLQSDP